MVEGVSPPGAVNGGSDEYGIDDGFADGNHDRNMGEKERVVVKMAITMAA